MERLDLQDGYVPIEMAIHSARYMPLQRAVPGRHVLDIACGEGLGASLMARWGAASVTGVDLSELAVTKAAEFARQAGVQGTTFIAADACEWLEATDRRFDVISSVETIEHLPDPERFLALCRDRLADDGLLLVSCPNDPFYYGIGQSLNPFHVSSFSFDDFRAMAEGILGPGRWMLGSPLFGFLTASMDGLTTEARDYAHAMADGSDGDVSLMPLHSNQRGGLGTQNAIYYVGLWGGPGRSDQTDIDDTTRPQAVVIPMASDQRMGGLRVVSADVAEGRERRMTIFHRTGAAGPQPGALDRLTRQLTGRYQIAGEPVRAITGKAGASDSDAAALFRGGPNTHFDDETLLAEVLDGIVASRADDVRRERLARTILTVRLRSDQDFNDPDRRRRLMLCDGVMLDDPAQIDALRDVTGLPVTPTPWMAASAHPTDEAADSPAADTDAPIRLLLLTGAGDAHADDLAAAVAAARKTGKFVHDPVIGTAIDAQASATALIASRDDHAALRGIEAALARGAAVILPRQHPMAGLIGADWRVDQMDGATIKQVLKTLHAARDGTDKSCPIWPGAANIEAMAQMDSVSHAARWTRFLATAQERNRTVGRCLRAAWLAG